ncbi:MAG: hypothetical protein JNL49_01935 [Bacteroidia bacterium]|nr:hypothetical protein [Bacteroidia bacterium]
MMKNYFQLKYAIVKQLILVVTGFAILISCNSGKQQTDLTFNKEIAPLIHKHCTTCHRPGEAGPFNLITYKDVRKKAKTIARVVETGVMPPWPADPEYTHFVGEKILTNAEKEMIVTWVNAGCPEGKASDLKPAPIYPEGSQLGKPDVVIRMEEPFTIPGDNRDRFMVFKIPYELDRDTFLRMVEYVPGNRKLSHHVNGHIIQYDDKLKKDVFVGPRYVDREDAGTLDSCYKFLKLLNDDETYPLLTPSVFNFLPGVLPQQYPDGIGGYRIKKKGAILMRDLHYGPTPVSETDQPHVNLFFSPKPPSRPFMETQLGTLGISEIVPPLLIPPDTVMKFVTKALIYHDISLVTINPHMHLLGKSFLAYAITPQADTIRLVRIPKWDFRWQYFYTYPTMLKIPAGSTIVAEGVFDNTKNNPNNPFSPPREITGLGGSMRTTDEMFQLILTFLPYFPGDEQIRLDNILPGQTGLE